MTAHGQQRLRGHGRICGIGAAAQRLGGLHPGAGITWRCAFNCTPVSPGALALGEFTAQVLDVCRTVGTMTGRFLHLLDAADQARMAEVYAGLPTVDGADVVVQLSFPPLHTCTDHVTLIANDHHHALSGPCRRCTPAARCAISCLIASRW